jgi:hypothetical protein
MYDEYFSWIGFSGQVAAPSRALPPSDFAPGYAVLGHGQAAKRTALHGRGGTATKYDSTFLGWLATLH